MPSKSSSKFSQKENKLIRRYLLWCYKTTRETIERIDRKFTQLTVDKFVLGGLTEDKNWGKSTMGSDIEAFIQYIKDKEDAALLEKYSDATKGIVSGNYAYLTKRLQLIEKAIKHFCGSKALEQMDELFEREMTQRILQARDH